MPITFIAAYPKNLVRIFLLINAIKKKKKKNDIEFALHKKECFILAGPNEHFSLRLMRAMSCPFEF